MKTKITLPLLGLALGITFTLSTGTALAQGTAFTYQGRLDSGGTPFNGSATFKPALWDAATNGVLLAGNSPTTVTLEVRNGLFTLSLDFGAQFPGADRWLQLEVATGDGPFTTLMPRQPIRPTPYALTADNLSGVLPTASLAGTYDNAVTFNNAGNVFGGNGSGMMGVNAVSVGGVSGANLWKLSGNSGVGFGQFLGTTDDWPLELRVNGQRALRLEPGIDGVPNVIGGALCSVWPGTFGATIGGGYVNIIEANGNESTIGGGYANTIQTNAQQSTIGGGYFNTIQGDARYATIGGGAQNTIQTNASDATIGGGHQNTIQVNSSFATIAGGVGNTIQVNGSFATIGGGYLNMIQTNAYYATIAGGNGNQIRINGYGSTVSGGWQNSIETDGKYSVIGGGWINTMQTNVSYAVIGGGYGNLIQSAGNYSVIAGGLNNEIGRNVLFATVAGGRSNRVAASYGFAAGTRAQANHSGAFVWADSQNADFASTANNEFNIRAQNGVRIQANKGIHLNALDAPIIVRDWDVFAASAGSSKAGVGRWGLFMEPTYLTMGIPAEDIPDRTFRVSKYNTNGTATALMTVNQAGDVTAKSFNPSSDRQLKENFEAVSPEEVLAKVVALPISRWNFKGETETAHVGPMAQDFHAAFGLGTDDKHIATVDADGVALAAIQGLNQKLETEAAALRTENTELKARLERLERLLLVQASGGAK